MVVLDNKMETKLSSVKVPKLSSAARRTGSSAVRMNVAGPPKSRSPSPRPTTKLGPGRRTNLCVTGPKLKARISKRKPASGVKPKIKAAALCVARAKCAGKKTGKVAGSRTAPKNIKSIKKMKV